VEDDSQTIEQLGREVGGSFRAECQGKFPDDAPVSRAERVELTGMSDWN
jgi:hypothetical protein